MKKNNSSRISGKLIKYGALTSLLTGVSQVSGQIIYTDVDPDEGGSGVTYTLDMDNDNNAEFQIRHFDESNGGSSLNSLFVGPALDASANAGNSIIASSVSGFAYPLVLNEGDAISAGNANWKDNLGQSLNASSCSSGNWCNETDKYLGLRFKIGNDVHYGWARLDVGTSGADWLIKDYAYNSVAGESIDAGETGDMSVKNTLANTVAIATDNKNIYLHNLPSKTSFKLYSMTGQQVLDGATEATNHTIAANSLKDGIYVVQIMDESSGELMRKKILL